MKNVRLTVAYVAIFLMVFTSCSKDEAIQELNSEKATLSLGAIVNDLLTNRAATKQAVGNMPACSADVPAYVSVVLSRDGVDVVGSDADPFEIQLVDGQIFTEEVAELQLDPDTYSLEHFVVYNDDDEVIWIAPRAGSNLGGWIDNPLPLSIDLKAGVKKYVEVSVLCFDNREVNEYGYLFFELNPKEVMEFCFFANYCPPSGRHYTARYSVSIWKGTNDNGTPIYTDVVNTTSQYENGDYYANPVCFALPDNDNATQPYLYYEVTLLDWSGNYGTVPAGTVISGTLTAQDIMNNFDGPNNVNYEHLRFGCDGGTTPPPGETCEDLVYTGPATLTGSITYSKATKIPSIGGVRKLFTNLIPMEFVQDVQDFPLSDLSRYSPNISTIVEEFNTELDEPFDTYDFQTTFSYGTGECAGTIDLIITVIDDRNIE